MIGERLFDLRKDAGLTQDELAEILNINKHSISSYERDRSEPPDEIKIKMAYFFNVSLDYLLGLSEDPNRPYKRRTHKTLRLPVDFPEAAITEIKEFCKYLQYKYQSKK